MLLKIFFVVIITITRQAALALPDDEMRQDLANYWENDPMEFERYYKQKFKLDLNRKKGKKGLENSTSQAATERIEIINQGRKTRNAEEGTKNPQLGSCYLKPDHIICESGKYLYVIERKGKDLTKDGVQQLLKLVHEKLVEGETDFKVTLVERPQRQIQATSQPPWPKGLLDKEATVMVYCYRLSQDNDYNYRCVAKDVRLRRHSNSTLDAEFSPGPPVNTTNAKGFRWYFPDAVADLGNKNVTYKQPKQIAYDWQLLAPEGTDPKTNLDSCPQLINLFGSQNKTMSSEKVMFDRDSQARFQHSSGVSRGDQPRTMNAARELPARVGSYFGASPAQKLYGANYTQYNSPPMLIKQPAQQLRNYTCLKPCARPKSMAYRGFPGQLGGPYSKSRAHSVPSSKTFQRRS